MSVTSARLGPVMVFATAALLAGLSHSCVATAAPVAAAAIHTPSVTVHDVKFGTVNIDGLNIAYREAGDPKNPKLVLLHWPSVPTFLLIVTTTLAGSYAIHTVLVERSPFMRFLLNGARPAWMIAAVPPAMAPAAPGTGSGQS